MKLRIYRRPDTGRVTVLPPRELVAPCPLAPGLTSAIDHDGRVRLAMPGSHLGCRIPLEECPPFLRMLAVWQWPELAT